MEALLRLCRWSYGGQVGESRRMNGSLLCIFNICDVLVAAAVDDVVVFPEGCSGGAEWSMLRVRAGIFRVRVGTLHHGNCTTLWSPRRYM